MALPPVIHVDMYGVPWHNLPASELCPTCGQPDNCGECNHEPLKWPEVIRLLGGVPIGAGDTLRPPSEVEMYEGSNGGTSKGYDGPAVDPHPPREVKGVRRRRVRRRLSSGSS